MKETVSALAIAAASLIAGAAMVEQANAEGFYTVECRGADGEIKWTDTIENLVTTVGKNAALDQVFSGTAFGTPYLGLVDNASFSAFAAGDTMSSHAGWIESTAYSNANRPTPSWGSASAGAKATTATAFNINATATINGCFLTTNNTKGGTTGTLYSCGSFSGGNRSVVNGDTLNVTYTASL